MKEYRYPGAQPFSTSQKHIFFGRKEDIEALYRSIRLEPLVTLHSKSGLGKSSLISAGLVPRVLKDGKYRPVSIRFNTYNPDSDSISLPIEATRAAVEAACKSIGKTTYVEKLLPEEDSLWYLIKREQAHLGNSQQLLLIFDQFEELFIYPEEEIVNLKKQLAEVLHTQIPQRFREVVEQEVENPTHLSPDQLTLLHQPFETRIIFAIRSDRISLLDQIADYLPDVKRSWYELKALHRDQAEDAILNPAYKKGKFVSPIFDYDEAAIEKMLGFLTRDGSQKIESFQLQILCQAIERKVIRQKLKVVTPTELGNIEEVYENYYDDQIRLIEDPIEQLASRRFIEEGLIFEEEERRLSLYEGQIFRQFGISEALLRKLEDTHLIRRESSIKGGHTYELSHDTLVAPVLRAKEERLEKERKAAAEQERLHKEKELAEARRKADEERQLREKAEHSEQRARQRTQLAAIVSVIAFVLALFAGWNYVRANDLRKTAYENAENAKKNAETAKIAEEKAIESAEIARKAEEEIKEKAKSLDKSVKLLLALTPSDNFVDTAISPEELLMQLESEVEAERQNRNAQNARLNGLIKDLFTEGKNRSKERRRNNARNDLINDYSNDTLMITRLLTHAEDKMNIDYGPSLWQMLYILDNMTLPSLYAKKIQIQLFFEEGEKAEPSVWGKTSQQRISSIKYKWRKYEELLNL